MSIQDRIRERMNDLNLSMRKLSLEAGLGETAVRDILKNEDQTPRLETLVSLSRALDTPLDWLVDGTGRKEFDWDAFATERMQVAWSRISTAKKSQLVRFLNGIAIMDYLFGDNWEMYSPDDKMWTAIKDKIRAEVPSQE